MDHQIAAIAITLASHPFQTLIAVISVGYALRALANESATRRGPAVPDHGERDEPREADAA